MAHSAALLLSLLARYRQFSNLPLKYTSSLMSSEVPYFVRQNVLLSSCVTSVSALGSDVVDLGVTETTASCSAGVNVGRQLGVPLSVRLGRLTFAWLLVRLISLMRLGGCENCMGCEALGVLGRCLRGLLPIVCREPMLCSGVGSGLSGVWLGVVPNDVRLESSCSWLSKTCSRGEVEL